LRRRIKELIEKGYRYRCLACGMVYKTPRKEKYEDGNGVRFIDMCGCGCDLFKRLEDIVCVKVIVKEPVNGTLVFKAHHAKYCRCEVGEAWTGDAETECWAKFELLDDGIRKVFICLKSGLKIVILKSTEEEMKNPDEAGSKYIRIPGV